jgi:predicted SprT family Zn-dependent metalloprotease
MGCRNPAAGLDLEEDFLGEIVDLHSAEILAKELIGRYNPSIQFKWSRTKQAFGDFSYSTRTIRLSNVLTPKCTEAEVRDTIMHEIAHSLCPPATGHGPVWQLKMQEFGLKPSKSTRIEAEAELDNLPGNWYGVCPSGHRCKKVFSRKPRKVRSCFECSPSYNPKFDLVWHKI